MPGEGKEKWSAAERSLLWFGLVLCALIVSYNLFFTKDFSASSIVLTTQPPSGRVSAENPESGQPETEGVQGVIKPESGGKMNLNEASASELAALLPGVGETLAARIIEYREEKGGFIHIEELLEIEGIGDATFAAIRDYLIVT